MSTIQIYIKRIFKLPIISLNNYEIDVFINVYKNIKKEIKDDEKVYKNEIIQNYINIFLINIFEILILFRYIHLLLLLKDI